MTGLFRSKKVFGGMLLAVSVLQLGGCSSPEERARGYYNRGEELALAHDNAKAAIEFRNAVKLKRDFIEAWKALLEVDEGNSDWPRVLTDLRAVVELAPGDVSSRKKLGKLLLLAGSASESLSVVKAGLQLDGQDPDLHTLKAAASLKLDDKVGAVREAQAAIQLDPANADALMILAIDRLSSGDAKGALSLLEGAAVGDADKLEDNVGLQLLKIKLFNQIGETNSVEATLKALIVRNPGETGYRQLLVDFYVEQHRVEDAERELRDLAIAHPSDPEFELGLIRFLYATKHAPDEARKELVQRIAAGGNVFPFQMALANVDYADGNMPAGKQLFEELIVSAATAESRQAARIALAQQYLKLKSFDESEKLINDALREDPHNVPALTIQGSIYLEHLQPDAAVTVLLNALNYQPRSIDLMLLLATAYERSGLIELADKQLGDAVRASGFDSRAGLVYAEFLQRRGSFTRAEDVLTGLEKRQANNPTVLSALARVKLSRRDWGGAQEIAGALRRTGDAEVADQIAGASLIGQGKYDQAIETLLRAYQANPQAVNTLKLLVSSFLKANKNDQASAYLTSILEKEPDNLDARVLLGSVQLAGGALGPATESLSTAIKDHPDDPTGYMALAHLYSRQENFEEAITTIRKAIEKQPDQTSLQIALAEALDQKGDYEAAISQYESIFNKQPDNLVVANNLASLLLDHRVDGPSVKKAQVIAAMLRKSPIPQFKDTLGWASYRSGDYSNAVSLCEEAASALPDQASVRFHLGLSYAATHRPDRATEQLQKALDLAPTGRLAGEIQTALKQIGQRSQTPASPS